MGRLGNGPSLQWAKFAMGRDVQLPTGLASLIIYDLTRLAISISLGEVTTAL